MNLLRVATVSRRFGNLTAVDRVSFDVDAGEVVGLVGANGAGKTTLIRMILGLLAPDEGEISVFGQVPSRVDRGDVGYVPQGLGLYRDLTVSENLAFTAGAFKEQSPGLDPGLASVADREVGLISLGLQRRLAFAAVLSHNPKLLLLDEPTSGVGPLGRNNLWDQIRGEAEAGSAVLVSTHYMEEAEQCDRVLLMAEGKLIADGTIDNIIGGKTTPWISGVDPESLSQAGIIAIPDGDGWRVPGSDTKRLRALLGPGAEISSRAMEFEEAFFGIS
jgi:ABC-type multidrug transport system ATPase subunit